MNSVWYVAFTKPRMELLAQDNLLRQEYRVQLPMVRRVVRRKVGLEPLFPRYLFLQPQHDQQSLSPVRSTTGVSNIIRFGMELAVLSNEKCQLIMDFAASQQKGGVDSLLEVQGIRVGEKVMVNSGPFAGLEGLVSSVAKDRVLVLLNLLGKEQSIGFQPTVLACA